MSLYTTGNLKTADAADSSYTSNGLPKKGDYVYAKEGITVPYYTDSTGQKQVGPSGGKGGQSAAPTKSGGEAMGIFTGKREVNQTGEGMLQVDWVNSWYQDRSWAFYIPFALATPGGRKTEALTSWVKESQVSWKSDYVAPKSKEDTTEEPPPYEDTNTGLNSTTLLLIGVGAAFLLKKKKGKR